MEKLEYYWRLAASILLLCLSQGIQAQVSLKYLPCQTCPVSTQAQTFRILSTSDDINSDFGFRDCQGASSWHRGTDLNIPGANDLGYHLLAPVPATITMLKILNTGYKYIVLDGPGNQDFGFGHIFNDAPLPIKIGDLVLLKCNNVNQYAIINLTTQKAIGPVQGASCTYNGITYTVNNQVAQGQVVAPLGSSGSVSPHLHLYHPQSPLTDPQLVSNAKDPMEVLPHYNTAYQVFIFSTEHLTTNGSQNWYPGDDYASVGVCCQLANPGIQGSPPDQYYHTAVMDIDQLELFIKPKGKPSEPMSQWGHIGSGYQYFAGPNYYSSICNASRAGSLMYPPNLSSMPFGSHTQTGIFPYAYNSNPFDNYYFSDIMTRIHKNHVMGQSLTLAGIIEDARYPDGVYQMFLRMSRVNGTVTAPAQSAIHEITIDNFRPYIKKTGAIKQVGMPEFYESYWGWNGSQLQFYQQASGSLALGEDAIIRVTASEPMKEVTLKIGTWQSAQVVAVTGTTGTEWEFEVPASAFTLGPNVMEISGYDLADNPLEGFTNINPKPAGSFPVRQAGGQWQPSPTEQNDIVHAFMVVSASPPVAYFTPSNLVINPGENVNFHDMSQGTVDEWTWDFPGGDPGTSSSPDPVVHYDSEGIYLVTLTVSNVYGSSIYNGIVVVTANMLPPTADFSPQDVTVPVNTEITFHDLSTGNPTQWSWNFDGASPQSNIQDPMVTFDQCGVYLVSLHVSNQAGSDWASGYVNVVEQNFGLEVLCLVNPFLLSPGTPATVSASVVNGYPPFQYTFDFGDGTTQTISSNQYFSSLNHSYLAGGTFHVIVTVLDGNGSLQSCDESVEVIGADPCSGFEVSYSISSQGYNTSVPVNNPVTFTAQITGGSQPYLYSWYFFPDPQTGAQPSVYHSTDLGPHTVVFPQAGDYSVSFHVCDQNGCGRTVEKSIHAYLPQHCLVSKINKVNASKSVHPIGVVDFWDFTFTPWCSACQDPPGTSNFPCETNNYWRLVRQPGNILMAQKSGTPFQEPGCTLSNSLDQLFQYNFSQAGSYELSLKAWDQNCQVMVGYDCMDQTSIMIDVIDCQQFQHVVHGSPPLVPGELSYVYGGVIQVAGEDNLLSLPAGTGIVLQASKEILLEPGFIASEFSELHGLIEPCQNGTDEDWNPKMSGRTGVDWEVYPNPTGNTITVRFSDVPGNKSTITLLNILGQAVKLVSAIDTREVGIDLTDQPPGVYLVLFKTGDQVLMKKITRI